MHDPTNSRYRHLSFRSANTYRRYVQGEKSNEIQKSFPKPTDNETPAHGTYAAELFKPEWKLKREEILKRDHYKCVVCRSVTILQVHHRQYHFIVSEHKFRLPWDYPDQLLITLCESCHKRGHSKYKVPTINI
jgi:5-methylcytosine-specific restriction endonuclease McrA